MLGELYWYLFIRLSKKWDYGGICLYPVDSSHVSSCSDPNFHLYKLCSNTNHSEFSFVYFAHLPGFLQECKWYGLRINPKLWFLLRLYLCISCCDWCITHLYFSITYIIQYKEYWVVKILGWIVWTVFELYNQNLPITLKNNS